MSDEVKFICDSPSDGFYVLTTPGRISGQAHARIKKTWENFSKSQKQDKLLVLEEGMKLQYFDHRTQWPDAEFCAA